MIHDRLYKSVSLDQDLHRIVQLLLFPSSYVYPFVKVHFLIQPNLRLGIFSRLFIFLQQFCKLNTIINAFLNLFVRLTHVTSRINMKLKCNSFPSECISSSMRTETRPAVADVWSEVEFLQRTSMPIEALVGATNVKPWLNRG